nr:AraC family transcriptional regulator [Leptospira ellisii]
MIDAYSLRMVSILWLRKILFVLDIVALTVSGTLVFLVSTMVFRRYAALPPIYYWHLLGPLILTIPIVTFYEASDRNKEFEFFLFVSDLYVFVYFVIVVCDAFIAKPDEFFKFRVQILVVLIALISICAPLEILGIVLQKPILILLSGVHTTFVVIYYYFMALVYPDMLNFLALDSSKSPVKRSILHDIDTDNLAKKLEQVVKEERIYLDEEIRLKDVSDELGISVHQLSYFLNNHLGMNFNNYINRFRVKEAKTMLVHDTRRSIISVGVAVGFNSNSSFYKAFLKETGMSPKHFRESHPKMLRYPTDPGHSPQENAS